MVRNEGDRLRKVIVCSPRQEYFRARELEKHNLIECADPVSAQKQHDILKSIMADENCEIFELPELEGHPNSVFIRDTALLTPEGFVRLRMGLPSRRGEEHWISEALSSLVIPFLDSIEPPGTAEGGDIILAGSTAFVGRSGRTNTEGVEQLRTILTRLGYEVRPHDVPAPSLHLGGVMSMIGPEKILCAGGVFDSAFLEGMEILTVDDASFVGANVICLDDDHVVACRSNSTAIGVLLEHEVRIHVIDLSEFIKGAGGPTCLILPIERNAR